MGQLEVEVNADQLKILKRLAQDHYGEGDEAAMGKVVEAALAMRLKWLEVGGPVAEEVGEPVATWESQDGSDRTPPDPEVLGWMFRREG